MSAEIVLFGEDWVHRVEVLKRAGYALRLARTLEELQDQLRSAADLHAVAVSETEDMDMRTVVRAIRAETEAPILLFQCKLRWNNEHEVSRVVESTESPQDWLQDLAQLIARYRPGADPEGERASM